MENEEKINDSVPDIFKDEEEKEEFPEGMEVAEKGKMYLINVSRPSRLTILHQKKISWFNSEGRKNTVEVIMHRDYDTEASKAASDLNLAKDQKRFIYTDEKGEYISGKTVRLDYSFTVLNYNHVLDFPIGRNRFNERRYTIKAGTYDEKTSRMLEQPLPTEISNREDGELLMRQFDFLEECDKNGKPLKRSKYRKVLEEGEKKVEGNIDWKNMKEISPDELPTRVKHSEGVNTKPLPYGRDEEEK